MTIVLHGGFHKTGTTALQHSLARYRRDLAQHGLIYPDFSRMDPNIREAGHFFFASSIAREDENPDKIATFLSEEAQQGDVLFLSAESLIRYTLQSHSSLCRSASKIAYLERVRSVLPEGDVTALLTLREPFRMIESYYQEFIKKTFSSIDFSDYMAHFFGNYDPLATVATWRAVFGGLELRSYEADCTHPKGISGAVIERFCSGFLPPEPPARLNTSLSPLAVDMLRFLNPHLQKSGKKAKVLEILQEISRDKSAVGRGTFWTRDLLAVAVPKLRADFEELSSSYAAGALAFSPPELYDCTPSRDTVLAAASRLTDFIDASVLQDVIETISPFRLDNPMSRVPTQAAVKNSQIKTSQLGNEVRFGDSKVWPSFKPSFCLVRTDKVFPIGSCFARNIEEFLVMLNLDVPTATFRAPKQEWTGRPSGILNKYTPPAIRQSVEWAARIYSRDDRLCEQDLEALTYTTPDGRVVDLQLASFTPVETSRHFERRAQIYDLYRQLFQSDVVAITLGLTEAWYDTQTNQYIDAAPITRELSSVRSRFELHNLTVEQSVMEVRRTLDLLYLLNPSARIILTTSPVPLLRSFANPSHTVANTYSKSTLRAACEHVMNALPSDRVTYFPSYEIVSNSRSWDFWQRDLQHIKSGGVAQIVQHLVNGMMPDLTEDEQDWLASFAYSSRRERSHAHERARALVARSSKLEHLEQYRRLEEAEKQSKASCPDSKISASADEVDLALSEHSADKVLRNGAGDGDALRFERKNLLPGGEVQGRSAASQIVAAVRRLTRMIRRRGQ